MFPVTRHRVFLAAALAIIMGLTGLVISHPVQAQSRAADAGMGSMQTVSRSAWMGYYDGHKDTYLNTDVSNNTDWLR